MLYLFCKNTFKIYKEMKVNFDATIDELIEVHERAIERSKVSSGWKNQAALITAFLGGIAIFIPVFFFFQLLGQGMLIPLSIAFIAAIPGAIFSFNSYKANVKDRLRSYFKEQYGERESIPFELEIDESGLCTRQLGVQSLYEWSNVEEIRQTENAVEFYLHGNGIIFVRKRAFNSEIEEDLFNNKAQHYLNYSRNSSNWLKEA